MHVKRDIDMFEDEPQIAQDSQVFTQHIPVIGKIPMVFYIPPCSVFEELSMKILRNGGRVVDQHECFTYQIKPDSVKTTFSEYYKGSIYSQKWIDNSITSQKCLNKDDYFLCINIDEKSKMLNIGKKKRYTIIEGIKLYETITNHKNLQINSSQFWLKAQKQGILPERTAESMKSFWKKNQYKTLEQYLIECIHESTDFCLSFKNIPNQEFVNRFKQQYSTEFMKLETLQDLDKEGNDCENKANFATINRNLGRQIVQPGQCQQGAAGLPQILSAALQEECKNGEDMKMEDTHEESKEAFQYQFKQIEKIQADKLTYSPFSYNYEQPHVYLSIDKRSLEAPTLEQEIESSLSQRMKKFIPSNFDLVDYDKELFKKQLDLETVQITITRDLEKEKEYQKIPYYVRSVVKFPNEEGMFHRLQLELQVIAQEYGVSDENINKLFIDVSCSKTKLLEALKGQSFTKWNELEDMALMHGTESKEYSYLLKTKGYDEILRRKKFLGI